METAHWKISGYDQMTGERYTLETQYSTQADAQAHCTRMEWVEKTTVFEFRIPEYLQPHIE